MAIEWNNVNKVRVHNKNESSKHFLIKAMVLKILFEHDYWVYTERDFRHYLNNKIKVSDVYAENQVGNKIIVEIESSPTKKHNKDLEEFYKGYNLYIVNAKKISNNIIKMEEQIKFILGM